MSLHQLAKQVQSKGRGNDKMLMHVTPREVSGLQAIAKANGGSLTINPDTGLVEAGFLDKLLPTLLPMAAGAALTVGSGGALSPLAASMIVGGGYGLATGSVEKGLMAGLGAYGGAGMAGGLGSAGAATTATEAQTAAQAVEAANAGVIPQAPSLPGMTPPPQATPIPGADSISTAFNLPAGPQATPFPTAQVTPNAGVYTGDLAAFSPAQQNSIIAQRNAVMSTPGIENIVSQPTGGISSNQMMGNVKQGIGQLGTETGRSAVYNALPTGTMTSAGIPITAAAMEPDAYKMPEQEKEKYSSGYSLSPDFQGYQPRRPNPYYRPTGLGYFSGGSIENEGGITKRVAGAVSKMLNLKQDAPVSDVAGGSISYEIDPRTGQIYRPSGLGYAAGGLADVMMARGGSFDDEPGIDGYSGGGTPKKPKKASLTGARSMATMDPYEASMAGLNNARYGANMSQMTMPKAGLAELGALPYANGGMAKGRYLRGGGDGMSDSIPATINGKQPARLADGEFVIPADVVSHLGNGSSDAGAKRLYAMMDKVRHARTGKKKQAPAVKADKYMPA
jgi:hypothetical protein